MLTAMNKDTLNKIITRLDQMDSRDLGSLFLRLAADRGVLQEVFDALRDGLILFDADGKPSLVNRTACTIYGRTLNSLMQETFEALVGGTCKWEEIRGSGVAITRDLQVNYPEKRHYNFLITPVGDTGGYLLLIQDDTEVRVRDEEDAEAQQFNIISFMASAVAHEIGNPLNSLGLNLQLLQRKLSKLPENQRASLDPLLESSLGEVKRLDLLLRQFLQSMRPSALKREKTHVNDILRQVIRVLEPEIAPRNITVRQALEKGLPELYADPAQLFQAFYNIIRNAYQSIPGEGDLYIQTDYNDHVVRIQIQDSGTGISHEVIGSMYEPFRTTKKKGNGLGLLIVRRIIKDHGGALSFASKEGQGALVTITLPRADRVIRLLPS